MSQRRRPSFIKKAFYNSFSQLFALMGGILFFFLIYRLGDIFEIISQICHILSPVIIGVVIAYTIHPIVNKMEKALNILWKKLVKKKNLKDKGMRIPAITLTFLLVCFVLYLLAYMVIPQLYENISNIVKYVPSQVTKYYDRFIQMISENSELSEWVSKQYQMLMDFLTGWVRNDMLDQVTLMIGKIVGVVGAVSNFMIGIIVAIYLLMSKEIFKRQFQMILDAFFSERVSAKVREILKESNRIFGGFISGKIIDSFIIGLICFAGAVILQLPYAALVSVIVGVTNIIPFFGPYIGAVPSTILIFLESPTKGIIFLVFVVILQQFDGNYLGPKILGESTGLSPFWVIFAILVGGGLFGMPGMIIGVPTFGVIYYLVKDLIHYRIAKKKAQVKQ